jgi:hypothetical protein
MHYIKIWKSSYKIKLFSNMFRWWQPPSSGKVYFISYDTVDSFCNAAFQLIKWTFPDGGGGHHRNMLQYSLIL